MFDFAHQAYLYAFVVVVSSLLSNILVSRSFQKKKYLYAFSQHQNESNEGSDIQQGRHSTWY